MTPVRIKPCFDLSSLLILAVLLLPAVQANADQDSAGPAVFERAWLQEEAQRLARQPYQEPAIAALATLDELDYDSYRRIQFRSEAAIWAGEKRGFVLELLYPGFIYRTPVEINLVAADGRSQNIPFDQALFRYGEGMAPPAENTGLAFTGLRVLYPINRPDALDEVVVFQGASYFRAVGRNQYFGASARGLAIKTANADGEEFPLFTRFWIEQPQPNAAALTVHALLDSASVVGAYTFVIRPGEETLTEVELELFPRTALDDFGIAPLTSMFLFDTSNRSRFDDYRNAVHDSDGLQMVSGRGERIWRPLANPLTLQISSFVDADPKGFGLVQRRRDFADYEDDEARYDLRPSTWVEPVGDWGPGFVQLIEIPAGRETNDNIVSFWRSKQTLTTDQSYRFAYRLHWCALPPDDVPLARVQATRAGLTPDRERRLFVVDFDAAAALPADLKPVVTASTGQVSNITGTTLNPTRGYRVSFEFAPAENTNSEFRLQLIADGRPWSETWLYRWTP